MNEQMYSVGPIMKAARKFKKLNQADVAQAIGCSQSALSKMEHNLLIPSAPQWFLFARFTAIPPESLETGIIDRRSPIRFNSGDVSMGFKIPKRYRSHRGVKVREIYPFLQILEKDSPSLVKEFMASTSLDPEFFLDFDNLVNFNLVIDIINFFIKHGMASSSDIRRVVEIGQNEIYWDRCGLEWRQTKSIEELLGEYVKVQPFFQMDFQVRLDKSGDMLVLTYLPAYHLKQMGSSFSEEFITFLNLYRKYTIENLIKIELGHSNQAVLSPLEQLPVLGARFEIS